ncbi:MAG: ferredoxin [Planctomycetota bacterium]
MVKVSRAHVVIRHKAAECIGCAVCEEVIPQYFQLDEDGMAQLLDGTSEGVFYRAVGLRMDEDAIQEAVDGCPVDIIRMDAS